MDSTREPLLTRATVVSAVGALVVILGWFGVSVTDTLSDQLVEVVLAVSVVAGPLVHALWARAHVTPVADPLSADGRPLVAIPDGGVITFREPRPTRAGDTGPIDVGGS